MSDIEWVNADGTRRKTLYHTKRSYHPSCTHFINENRSSDLEGEVEPEWNPGLLWILIELGQEWQGVRGSSARGGEAL